MKKVIFVVVALLLVSMVTYGQNGWTDDGTVVRLTTSSDKVGIGTTSPSKKLEVSGDIKIPVNYRMYFGGASIQGYNDYYDGLKFYGNGGGGNQLGITVDPSGKVGIRKASPSYELDVAGTVQMTGFKLTTGVTSGYVLTCDGSGVGTWQLQWSKNGSKIYYNSGYVGIGTTSPSYPLDVYLTSTGSSNVMRVGNAVNAAGEYAGIELSPGSGYSTQIVGIRLSGSYSPSALAFYTHPNGPVSNAEAMRIDYNGNVGIGTTSPGEKLEVNGNIKISGNNKITSSGILTVEGNPSGYGLGATLKLEQASNVYLYGGNGGGNVHDVILAHTGTQAWGRVGIGTLNPQSELAVNGTITAKKVKVTLNGWSDFVFADNYKLMPLNKLEKYIKTNKSLPDIPKEKEVVKEGVNLGEMQAKLLEKVEELTLYVIELKKENEELKNRISALEK
jgi:hypothetical protein